MSKKEERRSEKLYLEGKLAQMVLKG